MGSGRVGWGGGTYDGKVNPRVQRTNSARYIK